MLVGTGNHVWPALNTETFSMWMLCYLFLFLRRACCRVTQLLHQPLHIYNIYKIYTLKY